MGLIECGCFPALGTMENQTPSANGSHSPYEDPTDFQSNKYIFLFSFVSLVTIAFFFDHLFFKFGAQMMMDLVLDLR